jgi:uncharacterized membrane protein (UPF0127 family)
VHAGDGRVLWERCTLATTSATRLRGLLGRTGLEPGEGLLLRPANAVHMCFMRFAIDAVFLDREDRVVKVAAELRPWRAAGARGARAVLEVPAGSCASLGVQAGDRLAFGPPPGAGDGAA